MASSSLTLPSLRARRTALQLVELDLREVEIVQEMTRKGTQLVGGRHQPLQHRVRVDLEHARRPPDAQASGQAPDDVHDELDCHAFTRQERAMGFEKVAPTAAAIQLSPGATVRMPVGADIASPEPAAIATGRLGTEMVGGVDVALAATCRGAQG